MKPAAKSKKKPVSNEAEAYAIPNPLGSRFARMFLPAPWIVQLASASDALPKCTLFGAIKQGLRNLLGLDEVAEDAPQYHVVRVAPGTELTDRAGCQYHVARDGSLRLGVPPEKGHVPAELHDDRGNLLFGRARRFVLRRAKLLVQRFERRALLRGEPSMLANVGVYPA